MQNNIFMRKSLVGVTAVALLTLGLISCSDDDAAVTPEAATSMGVFLDAEVEGLTYQSGNNAPAVTDNNGIFEYTPGQPLSFSVGGVQLGTLTDGATVCTPNDFIVPENIARFLQSLDADNDPSNGIDVTAAAAALAGQIVTSDVFENPSSAGFETDPAIVSAISAAGSTLLDTATTNANLRDGTDNTFDPAELAGLTFIIADPLENGFGFVSFDIGTTGSLMPFSESVAQGGGGIEDDFSWNVNTAGVLTLFVTGGKTVTITRAGGSSRALSIVVAEPGLPLRAVTLLKPLSLTEMDVSGAAITPSGTSTGVYTVTSPAESEQVTFTSDGTMFATGSVDGPWAGTWSIGALSPNSMRIIDGTDSTQMPNDWTLMVLLDGSLTEGGSFFIGDVRFTGNAGGEPNLVWQSFFFVSAAPSVN